MKNKSGQVGLTAGLVIGIALALVILIVGLTAGFKVLFYSKYFLYALGTTIIVMTFIYGIPNALQGNFTKQKRNFLLGVFALGVIVVLLPALGVVQNTFAPVSISKVDYVDGTNKVLVYATVGGGQALQIDMTPSALNSYLQSQGVQATKSVTLKANYIGSDLKFPFDTSESNNNAVYLVRNAGTYTILKLGERTVQDCKDKGVVNAVAVVDVGTFSSKYDCYEAYTNGNVLGFTGTRQGGFQVEFDLNGEKSILSNNQQSISLGGGKALISWQGNLLEVNDVQAPGYDVFHIGSNWRLVDENAFGNVRTAYSQYLSCVGSKAVSPDKYKQCQETYYNLVNSNLASKDDNYISQSANIKDVTFTQGVATVDLRDPVFKPTFTIELDASAVGIIKLSGNPDITQCANDVDFSQAGSKSVPIKVKNTGSQEGYFDISVSCDKSTMSGSATSSDFNAGQEKTVNLQINGGNTGLTTNDGTCTVTVKDRSSGKADSCSFGVSVEYNSAIGQCSPEGAKTCSNDGKFLQTCTNAVLTSVPCALGCEVTGTGAICKTSGSVTPGTDIKADCDLKASNQPFLGWTYTESNSQSCGFLCNIGIKDPEITTTGQCKASFVPYYTLGAIVLILGIIAVSLFIKKPTRRRRK